MKIQRLISHLFAAGAGIYGLIISPPSLIMPNIAYAIITSHNSVGVIKYFIEDNHNVNDVCDFSRFMQLLLAFPCFVGGLWLKHGGVREEVAYAHPIISLIPLVSKFSDKNLHERELINTIMLLNTISGLYVSLFNENWLGVMTTIACAITFGAVRLSGRWNRYDQIDELNVKVGMSTIMSFYALGFHSLN